MSLAPAPESTRKRSARTTSPQPPIAPASTEPPGVSLTVSPIKVGRGLGIVTPGTVVRFTQPNPGKLPEIVHYVGTVLGAHPGPGDLRGGESQLYRCAGA